jgi:hypothetical protein
MGGVFLAALVAHLLASEDVGDGQRWLTFGVRLLVALTAALEGFLHFGERWRHYRQTADRLKAEGWLFFGLAGEPYARLESHSVAMRTFVKRVEQILANEMSLYFGSVAEEGPDLPVAGG